MSTNRTLELKNHSAACIHNCPITLAPMQFPVDTQCNHTFEKEAILKWIQTSDECPVCRTRLNVIGPKIETKPQQQHNLTQQIYQDSDTSTPSSLSSSAEILNHNHINFMNELADVETSSSDDLFSSKSF